MNDLVQRCGYVALIGRPNAGKSTLLNRLIGEKIAAVSNKPQTTRTRIQGVVTSPQGQIVFVDTPGVHKPGHRLNKRMMHTVLDTLQNVDLVMLLRDATVASGHGEQYALELVRQSGQKAILALNKVDALPRKDLLLPLIDWYRKQHDFLEVVPISALKGEAIDLLVDLTFRYLPEGRPIYDEETLTDASLRSIAAEMVREKILQSTEQELPFATAVACEHWEETDQLARIFCAIYVERKSQRAIVLGKAGKKIRQIGIEARRDIERLIGKQVYLELFVKVHEHWRDDETTLNLLGV
ncbi:MAG: GTPase Era [Acidobacteriota bacterium]|nr:GTPase Era [Blastocatellia bacterium]MDW8413497.1 GTPase Era [Acidobacteriota bacterium]